MVRNGRCGLFALRGLLDIWTLNQQLHSLATCSHLVAGLSWPRNNCIKQIIQVLCLQVLQRYRRKECSVAWNPCVKVKSSPLSLCGFFYTVALYMQELAGIRSCLCKLMITDEYHITYTYTYVYYI